MKKILILLMMLVIIKVGYSYEIMELNAVEPTIYNIYGTETRSELTFALLNPKDVLTSDSFYITVMCVDKPDEVWIFERTTALAVFTKAKEWVKVARVNKVKELAPKSLGIIEGQCIASSIGIPYFGYVDREAYFTINNGVPQVYFRTDSTNPIDKDFDFITLTLGGFTVENIDTWYTFLSDEYLPSLKEAVKKHLAEKEKTESLFN